MAIQTYTTNLHDLPLAVDYVHHQGYAAVYEFGGPQIMPAEPEHIEIICVRAKVNGQWVGRQMTDNEYEALASEILGLYQ